MDQDVAKLIEEARDARERAVAPYSNFQVGAALEAADGGIFTGCNVENASYGLSICAERVAVFTALSAGKRVFSRLAVVTVSEALTPPCGACRQVLWEHCRDIEVWLANTAGKSERVMLAALFPQPFDASLL